MLTWDDCPIVVRIPGKVGGAWVFKDTRLPLWAIFENLHVMTANEVAKLFGGVTGEQIRQCFHLSEMRRKNRIVMAPSVPRAQQTKSIAGVRVPRQEFRNPRWGADRSLRHLGEEQSAVQKRSR